MSTVSKIYDYFDEIIDEEKIFCNQCNDWFDKRDYEATYGPIMFNTPITCPYCGFTGVIK